MNREKMIEAAKASLIAQYGEPESKAEQREFNAWTPAMADFAIEQVKAERKRIAKTLSQKLDIDVVNEDWRQVANYVDELEAE